MRYETARKSAKKNIVSLRRTHPGLIQNSSRAHHVMPKYVSESKSTPSRLVGDWLDVVSVGVIHQSGFWSLPVRLIRLAGLYERAHVSRIDH